MSELAGGVASPARDPPPLERGTNVGLLCVNGQRSFGKRDKRRGFSLTQPRAASKLARFAVSPAPDFASCRAKASVARSEGNVRDT